MMNKNSTKLRNVQRREGADKMQGDFIHTKSINYKAGVHSLHQIQDLGSGNT